MSIKKKVFKGINTVLHDKDKKPYLKIGWECFSLLIKQKELPIHYFTCLLYKNGNTNIDDYVSNKKMRNIRNNIYKKTLQENPILLDKILFEDKLRKNNISTTNTVLYNRGGGFVFEGSTHLITNDEDFSELLLHVFNTKNYNSLFIKPVDGVGGKNNFKVNRVDIYSKEKVNILYKLFKENDYIVQEVITQHPIVSSVYPKSINTIRVHTYMEGKERKIASALIRFGKEERVVDNGGIYVSINTNTWSLDNKARELFEYGAQIFKEHPDTKVSFHKFKLPFAADIETQVLAAARLFDAPLIGWDIALTPQGPLIIEANHNPHMAMAQQACKGFQNNEHFKFIFQNYI